MSYTHFTYNDGRLNYLAVHCLPTRKHHINLITDKYKFSVLQEKLFQFPALLIGISVSVLDLGLPKVSLTHLKIKEVSFK